MQIKIALPKGRLLKKTSAILQKANWGLDEYHSKADFYHPKSQKFPNLIVKIFHEKDIPIQVAVGNYDLGICGLDWIDELLVKYPSSALVKLKSLGYGQGAVYASASPSQLMSTLAHIKSRSGTMRIASEYPNLAESFALKNRLSRFSVFPLWGAAEVYPPEGADLALVSGKSEAELWSCGMVPITKVLDFDAFLIANRDNWTTKDLNEVVASLCDILPTDYKPTHQVVTSRAPKTGEPYIIQETAADTVRLALPDGHQQSPTINLLNKAGIQVDDYPSDTGNRRPAINLKGVMVKVIRPQDMPLQVANGNFDLAVTGRDWLTNHLCQFPSSPVKELLNLGFGKVRIVAVVGQDLPAGNALELREYNAKQPVPLRIASEYVNIADQYARENHLGSYRVIPTWGATESFLPDDADLLVENTQTGRTIARHKLRIIDTLFESTACLIGNTSNMPGAGKSKKLQSIIESLQTAVEAAA